MNERIKELANQAREYTEKYNSERGNKLVAEEWTEVYNQKFAELIVRECADLRTEIELVGLHSEDYEQGVWEGIQMYQNQIKRHFNIK